MTLGFIANIDCKKRCKSVLAQHRIGNKTCKTVIEEKHVSLSNATTREHCFFPIQ